MTLLRPGSSWYSPAEKLCSLALASLSCPLRPGGGSVCSGGRGWVGCSIIHDQNPGGLHSSPVAGLVVWGGCGGRACTCTAVKVVK